MHAISVEGRLNIEVDELATRAYQQPGISGSAPTADVFAEEVYGVFINGSKVTSKLKQRVIDQCGTDALLQYLSNKYRLSEGKIDGINWEALAKYLGSLSAPCRATQVKLQHGWIPTNGFLFIQKRASCDKCPLCSSVVETALHVRQCKAVAASTFRRSRLSQLSRELQGINTAPEIINCWTHHIAESCGDLSTDEVIVLAPRSDIHKALGLARRHQSVLSWEGFLQGRVSSRWNAVQACHEKLRRQETASANNKVPWDVRAIRLVCEFNAALWAFRNDEVHGRTQQEAQRKLRTEVEAKVVALYARHPTLLPRYPSVHSMPLEVRLKKPTLTLQMWIKQVLQQEHLTDIARWKAAMSAGCIDKYLVPRPTFLKSEGKFVEQPEALQYRSGATIVKWMRHRVRIRSSFELPRMGIGDPG